MIIIMRFDTNIQVKIKDAYASRHEPEAERVLAHIYWAFLVVMLSLTIVLSVGYGVWEFFHVPTHEDATLGVRPAATFTRAQLQATLKGFEDRAERFQTRMTAPVTAKDPSK